jgi:hypothetical protein
MKGVKLFLVLKENNKPCYKLIEEIEELNYTPNSSSDIMYTSISNGEQIGNSIYGKLEDKEKLKTKLFKYYERELKNRRKELEREEKLFSKFL